MHQKFILLFFMQYALPDQQSEILSLESYQDVLVVSFKSTLK